MELESQDSKATAERTIRVTDDVLDSASERQKGLMQRLRKRFRRGLHRTWKCSACVSFNGRLRGSVRCNHSINHASSFRRLLSCANYAPQSDIFHALANFF